MNHSQSLGVQGQGRARRGGGGERENWADRKKDIIKAIIGPETAYYKRLKGKATSIQQFETWQEICVDICHESGWLFVNYQK